LDSVQERGVLCSIGATAGEVEVLADPSGARCVGALLIDVVNQSVPSNLANDGDLDSGTASTTRNFNKNETYKGGKVPLGSKR